MSGNVRVTACKKPQGIETALSAVQIMLVTACVRLSLDYWEKVAFAMDDSLERVSALGETG